MARMPANAAAGTVTFPVPPIADSRSQTSVFVTRPIPLISYDIPARMSPACRDGIINRRQVAGERQRHQCCENTNMTTLCSIPCSDHLAVHKQEFHDQKPRTSRVFAFPY